ncbi:MAG TPA: hypothetical protein VL503_00685 [Candidatus Omnitrophota bacterium]|nr:hypothetical protein [Candidatus Omnitrophota bacterium]
MSWAGAIKWIMLVSGALTCTMVSTAFTPAETLRSIFGAWPESPETDLVARNWGILIGLMGALLIYGAFHPAVQKTALVVAGASKAVFAALVLAQGGRFLSYQAGIAVAVDTVWVLIFAAYLWSSRARRVPATH